MLRLLPWIILNSMLKNSHRVRFGSFASDIAKYGIGTPGEQHRGAGAVAMLINQNPRILSFNDDNVAKHAMSWILASKLRDNSLREWIYSTPTISRFSENNLGGIQKRTGLATDFACLLPFTLSKIGSQGLEKILDKSVSEEKKINYNTTLINRFYTANAWEISTLDLFSSILLSLLEK